ncbi:MAG: NAD(+)/NADH kinase [Acidimicrobiia bacterium]
MKFSLEIRQGPENARIFAEKLHASIDSAGGEVVDESDGGTPDFVLAVGGDGTVLAAAQRALAHDVPILGFNLGTIGFLAEAEPDEIDDVIARLISGDYEVSERMTVTATVNGESATGVNDVIVEKVDSQRLIQLEVSVDGAHFLSYRVDGLIIATPTGSTAYSFSARGPLIDPVLSAMILTPVAAHSLFDRTLVLPPTTRLSIEVGRDRPVKVTVDKIDMGHLGTGQTVEIKQGQRPVKFARFRPRPFSRLITDKFGLS